MRKKDNRDVMAIIADFRKTIARKPPVLKMLEDVRMMKFKVHPVHGDISQVDLKNGKLLETLWSLGKLDELFQKEYRFLSTSDKGIFARIFDGLFQQFQAELNGLSFHPGQTPSKTPVIEMEIFREKHSYKKIN